MCTKLTTVVKLIKGNLLVSLSIHAPVVGYMVLRHKCTPFMLPKQIIQMLRFSSPVFFLLPPAYRMDSKAESFPVFL